MQENKQKTELSKSQFREEHGLNDLFAMLVNGLMLSERRLSLVSMKRRGIKAMATVMPSDQVIGSKLQLKILRTIRGFSTCNFNLLNEQEEQIKKLCFKLYGKGLTTRT